jgi:hypothetical protein
MDGSSLMLRRSAMNGGHVRMLGMNLPVYGLRRTSS